MTHSIERRTFFGLGVSAAAANFLSPPFVVDQPPTISPDFPRQDTALVREMVGVAHGNLDRVRALLAAKPALARAAIDWGFGDWESALEAASHTGRREIALLLIGAGARPSIFSAAMLGQLPVVEAFVTATPGAERILGPHSISLLAHARAGGEPAAAVRVFLERLGGADASPPTVPLAGSERDRYLGGYQFGAGATDRLEVAIERDALVIRRTGGTARNLRHLGDHAFVPSGAEAVRIRFAMGGSGAETVSVYDPDVIVTGIRVA